ncbi:pyridoxal phosphate-dependent aminotransferase [Natroniella sulfidigena]|uniref:pyridoxal phosphate-dependent aminotransferase n=1 Tax=Natroniella sulfidigena TaxID=723921 RepID=UPI00200B16F9|nr:pyridoxal phosphate-dependent aminotransferase [Natroniella sulfidigena]MCK8817913.1 pyridoxal phosphate-dependent aminotransferase [Natroniella sulfidigena]
MVELSTRISQIQASPTLAISAEAKRLKEEGRDIIGLGAGEPDFETPQHVKQAGIEAIQEGFTTYTATVGIKKLQGAVCTRFKEDKGLEYQTDQVIISTGAKQSLFNALQAIINPGDEVILPVPYWVSYPEQIKFAGGRPVKVKTAEEDGFKLTAQQLKEAITPQTKAIIINSPNNPTGAVYTKQELVELAEVIVEEDILVIADEIYQKISYEQDAISIAALGPKIKERTVVIDGVSKAYAMTGWRIGYAVGPQEIIAAMGRLQSHSTSNANSIAQRASIAALLGTQEPTLEMKEAFDQRREIIIEGLNQISGLKAIKPAGAFYLFVNITGLVGKTIAGQEVTDDQKLAELLLQEAGVATIPGSAFGQPGYLRLSYAASEEQITEAIKRINSLLNN